MKTTTKNIGLYKVGTLFCIEVTDVKNDGTEDVADVEVAVDVPEGVKYNSGSFPQGAYDSLTDKWLVGTLQAGANLTASFCYEVTDQTKGPFVFTFSISSPNSCANCDTDRQFCVIVEGTSCADVQACGECSESELLAYMEGSDPVYKRCLLYTYDPGAGLYEMTEFPIISTDIIKWDATIKYFTLGIGITETLDEQITAQAAGTYWTIGDANAPEVSSMEVRITVYYKKQPATQS